MSNPTAVVGRRIGAFLIDGLIGVTLIFAFALATFTNTQFEDSFTAELQCEVINEFSNDLCIQAGTTLYVGTGSAGGVYGGDGCGGDSWGELPLAVCGGEGSSGG